MKEKKKNVNAFYGLNLTISTENNCLVLKKGTKNNPVLRIFL